MSKCGLTFWQVAFTCLRKDFTYHNIHSTHNKTEFIAV